MAFTYTYTGTEDRIIDIRFEEGARIVTYKSQYQNYQKRENKNYQFR